MACSMLALTVKDLDNATKISTYGTYNESTRKVSYDVVVDGVVTQMNDEEYAALFKAWENDLELVSYKAEDGTVRIISKHKGKGCKDAQKWGREYMKTYAETH